MRLVYEDTGVEVKNGDEVETFRGAKVNVVHIEKPKHGGSTGRVYVKDIDATNDTHCAGYFPSVIGAEWIEREDQGYVPPSIPMEAVI